MSFIGEQNFGREDIIAEDSRRSERHRHGFNGLGGHSANQEDPEVF